MQNGVSPLLGVVHFDDSALAIKGLAASALEAGWPHLENARLFLELEAAATDEAEAAGAPQVLRRDALPDFGLKETMGDLAQAVVRLHLDPAKQVIANQIVHRMSQSFDYLTYYRRKTLTPHLRDSPF